MATILHRKKVEKWTKKVEFCNFICGTIKIFRECVFFIIIDGIIKCFVTKYFAFLLRLLIFLDFGAFL